MLTEYTSYEHAITHTNQWIAGMSGTRRTSSRTDPKGKWRRLSYRQRRRARYVYLSKDIQCSAKCLLGMNCREDRYCALRFVTNTFTPYSEGWGGFTFTPLWTLAAGSEEAAEQMKPLGSPRSGTIYYIANIIARVGVTQRWLLTMTNQKWKEQEAQSASIHSISETDTHLRRDEIHCNHEPSILTSADSALVLEWIISSE